MNDEKTPRVAGPDSLTAILAAIPEKTRISLDPGDVLYQAGDDDDALYLVSQGRLQVLLPPEKLLAELHPGDLAGVTQMLTGGRRTTTVRAATATTLTRFTRAAFERTAASEPALHDYIRRLALRRLRHEQLAVLLPALFGELTPPQMEEIESLGRWVHLDKGEALFEQGDAGSSAGFLISGRLRVMVRKPDGSFRLANHIRRGELVGEMAILTGEPRAATVYATRQSAMLVFGKTEFFLLLEKYPRFTLVIARLNIDRLRQSISQAGATHSTSVTALVPASADVPLPDFSRRLAEALSPYCAVLPIDRARLNSILGSSTDSPAARDNLINSRFPAWLSSEEGKYRLILLETSWNDPVWTEQCIRQADQVITVGLASRSPELSPIEAACVYRVGNAGEMQKRLVLIHPDDCARPSGTARWLLSRAVEMHHHVRLGHASDFARLARFLTDAAICVALGGGGARGFAHLGALRALREDNLPIDIIGGTSMGSIVGAEHALGMPPERMIDLHRNLFTKTGLALDLTLPLLSFTTGKAYARGLKKLFGDVAIEDLWIPYFCVSSNISRAERAIHRCGPLWRAVRASSGVQGLFPPVVLDGELHVDGALFSNLPADAMKTVCEGKVIAIDVSPPVDLLSNTDYGDSISGWKILWNRLFAKDVFRSTDIGTVMQRSSEAVSMANQKLTIQRMADFYMRMPVERVGMFAFRAAHAIEGIGYEHARRAIAEWKSEGRWIGGG
jgi:NTE family protein/lysophospholipid hydrolase